MIRDHRQFIIRWIRHALKLGKLNEGTADLPSVEPPNSECHTSFTITYEQEKFITISDESVSIHSVNSKAQEILEDQFEPRGSTVSELPRYSLLEPPSEPLLGDVALSNGQSRQYICAHVYCKDRQDIRYTTWFDILLHARTHHSAGRLPWSAHSLRKSQKEDANQPILLCVNDAGKYLASRGPYTNIPTDHDREELAALLVQLYRAVREDSIPAEIPQLMYDLYYSRRCAFSDCRVTSSNDSEHRHVI